MLSAQSHTCFHMLVAFSFTSDSMVRFIVDAIRYSWNLSHIFIRPKLEGLHENNRQVFNFFPRFFPPFFFSFFFFFSKKIGGAALTPTNTVSPLLFIFYCFLPHISQFSLSRSHFFSPNRFDLGRVDCSFHIALFQL